MIGQKQTLEKINYLIDNQSFPRFLVITGDKGQGKKTLAREIANKLHYLLIENDIKVDDIRNMIEMSYKQTEPTIYLIADADKMSSGAKNSLLKVIEEPPNNSYFIMTLQTLENTLETIKSRCFNIQLEDYTEMDLNKMIDLVKPDITSTDRSILIDICRNYRQVELLVKYDPSDFYNYVLKVSDNIYKVQSANSFKITEKLDLKEEGTGYDINLFFEVYKNICLERLIKNEDDLLNIYNENIKITSKYQQKLNITGISKQSLLDMWILDIRKAWRSN